MNWFSRWWQHVVTSPERHYNPGAVDLVWRPTDSVMIVVDDEIVSVYELVSERYILVGEVALGGAA